MRASGHRRTLTAAEELRLARRIEGGDAAAKEEMVARNLGLVWSIAARYRGCGVPFDDLLQEGAVGLVRAVDRFDHRRRLKFSTYAVWWIRRSLHNALSDARPIRIPPAARRQMAEIERARGELRRLRATPPTTDDIARCAGLSVRTVRALEAAPRVTASLDEPIGDATTPLGELIGDDGAADAARWTEERETSRQLWAMLRILPGRQREVVLRRYGLRGDPPQTHEEIGAWLGVCEERSRQLEREALHRLRSLGDVRRLAA
jgi:RNA polymerase primary sigma factor